MESLFKLTSDDCDIILDELGPAPNAGSVVALPQAGQDILDWDQATTRSYQVLGSTKNGAITEQTIQYGWNNREIGKREPSNLVTTLKIQPIVYHEVPIKEESPKELGGKNFSVHHYKETQKTFKV